MNTRGPELPTDGPDHVQRDIIFLSRVEFQADSTQLVCSTGANVSVMVLQFCKSSPQKNRPLESDHRRGTVWVAIEYSYKLGHKMNLHIFANPVTNYKRCVCSTPRENVVHTNT